MRQEKIKFALRATIFLILALAPLMPELLANFGRHNFRTWESISTRTLNTHRPFYVDKFVEREEKGDLGFRTPFAVIKKVMWKTDAFGYRNSESPDRYDIIVFGDSEITGSGLTQEDTFTSQLSKTIKRSVYNFAPATINDFAAETRFNKNPPKIVIFGRTESSLYEIPSLNLVNLPKKTPSPFLFIEKIEDLIDYVLKFSFYRKKLADFTYDPFPENIVPLMLDPNANMIFSPGFVRTRENNIDHFNKTIETIEGYHHFFAAKGIEFIFMPIPDKETIYSRNLFQIIPLYWDYTIYFNQLYSELDKRKIKTIKLYEPFMQSKELMVQLDDSHWNEKGVQIAVNETAILLNKLVVK